MPPGLTPPVRRQPGPRQRGGARIRRWCGRSGRRCWSGGRTIPTAAGWDRAISGSCCGPGSSRNSPAEHRRRRVIAGEPQLDRDAEVAVLRAVENTIWGLGRLQQLLDLPEVEDIHIVGADAPAAAHGRRDRSAPRREPVADSDADLIAQLQYVAAHHGGRGAGVLPGPAVPEHAAARRLAAGRDARRRAAPDGDDPPPPAGRCPPGRPGPALGMLDPGAARFLTALVARAAQRAGHRDAGVREDDAAARAGPGDPARRAGRHPGNRVRARPAPAPGPVAAAGGVGDAGPGRPRSTRPPGSGPGEVTLSDLLHQTLRMSVTRVIVGEVRGAEALPMLEAMNAGMPGSMCTLHAGSATDAMERLVTAALQGRRPRLVGHLRHPPGRPRHRLRRAPAPPPPAPHPAPHRGQHPHRAARPRRNCRSGGAAVAAGRVGSSPRSPR